MTNGRGRWDIGTPQRKHRASTKGVQVIIQKDEIQDAKDSLRYRYCMSDGLKVLTMR